ncbi:hypothetical protein BK741_18755 [Bacillus thuringiensis serovar iberica]|uniref:Uncharacterized protein n=1 Tax=Bacillus thuringiensis serovar iberica TaxID=180866 RepID=A0A9X6LPN0_BACTU|nr:hypothetical protein BK741_18755 [Bacillus thuringiensis serovar iberica]
MKQSEYKRNHYMTHTPRSHPLEGVSQSAAAIDDAEQVQSHVSFCSIVPVPQGFLYVPAGTRKVAYNLSGLSVVKETCQKTITVDNCGPVDVALNLLKVVGSIPYLVNAQVQGECGEKQGGQTGRDNQIELSHTGHIQVNTVLKFSVATLPEYQIREENISISAFEVTPVQEQGNYFLRFTGTLTFQNIPQ